MVDKMFYSNKIDEHVKIYILEKQNLLYKIA